MHHVKKTVFIGNEKLWSFYLMVRLPRNARYKSSIRKTKPQSFAQQNKFEMWCDGKGLQHFFGGNDRLQKNITILFSSFVPWTTFSKPMNKVTVANYVLIYYFDDVFETVTLRAYQSSTTS